MTETEYCERSDNLRKEEIKKIKKKLMLEMML